MRILMISDVYFPRINGVSTSIQTFSREFAAKGHHVTLIAPDYGQGDDPKDAMDIIRVPARKVIVDPEDRMLKMKYVTKLIPELARQSFDILHIQTPFVAHYAGLTLARRLNLPRIETYHTFFEEYLYNYIPFLPSSWLKFVARRFSCAQCNDLDALVVPSVAMLDVLRCYGVRSDAAVIPTGIELADFKTGDGAAFRRQYGIPAERSTLVHVGRIAHEKNIDFLLRMLVVVRQHIADVLLVIAGEGPALKHLRKLAHTLQLEDNILFVGYLSRGSGLQDCYSAGDVFVFASRTETQGLVLLEAMALGVPVVSTAVMGTQDILLEGKGARVAREEPGDFADKVVSVLSNRQLRQTLSVEARSYAQVWTADLIADRMLAFYEERIMKYRAESKAPCQAPAIG
ncbi:MAG TPA: glycosyltransferase family 4 protein [Acidiferrobacteraceae bacterium]|nr:glycosyltransferase family 4 protein [Acidiferrobacteraceae bacterium]